MNRLMVVLAFASLLLASAGVAQEPPRGFLGVALVAEDLPDGSSVVSVDGVFPDTPAAAAGLQLGDRFVEFDGVHPTSVAQLVELCASRAPGTTVSLIVSRGGEEQRLKVMLGLRPDMAELQKGALVDQEAPPLSVVPLAGGEPITLAGLTGKVVVLDFWASWCGPCRASIPHLNELSSERAGDDFVLLGITDETEAEAAAVAASMTYRAVRDADGSVNAAYTVFALPTLVVIDRAGVVRHVKVGGGDLGEVTALIDRLLAAK